MTHTTKSLERALRVLSRAERMDPANAEHYRTEAAVIVNRLTINVARRVHEMDMHTPRAA